MVQGVPQSQATVKPWQQEEEKMTEKDVYKMNKQMHKKHIDQDSLLQARESQC